MEIIVPDVKIDFKELISGFAFPLDIKNDIIYCQKSLRTYIKVHQAIVARMGNNTRMPSVRKSLDELEKEICEINSEQKLLLIRLRCALDEYYISLKNDNVVVDHELGNGYISRMFSGCIDDPNYLCGPINVRRRLNEKELLEKFMPEEPLKKTPEPVDVMRSLINPRQVSLLKPKAERFAQRGSISNIFGKINTEFNDKLQKTSQESIKRQEKEQEDSKPLTLTSPAINTSRMRLLQALQKAQTMNALKTKQQSSAILQSKINYDAKSPQSSTSEESPDTRETSPSLSDGPTDPADYNQEMFLKIFGLYTLEHSKYLTQRRSKRKRRNVQNNEKSDYHYGNLDLLDSPHAEKKKKEYLFVAPSTRGRRNVQNNEKSDYYYGNLDSLDSPHAADKKKNEYLFVAPSTRGRKRKVENDKDTPTCSKNSSDRSNSSSPTEEKVRVICNECLREGDTPLCKCENCNGVFHTKCQKGAILRQPLKFREKCCPTCYRIKQRDTIADEQSKQEKTKQEPPKQEQPKQEQQQRQPQPQQPSDNHISELRQKSISLIENRNKLVEKYNELHKKYESFYIRNRGLTKRSDIFKTKLNKLLHIIDSFK